MRASIFLILAIVSSVVIAETFDGKKLTFNSETRDGDTIKDSEITSNGATFKNTNFNGGSWTS